jgi:hypothetical protein
MRLQSAWVRILSPIQARPRPDDSRRRSDTCLDATVAALLAVDGSDKKAAPLRALYALATPVVPSTAVVAAAAADENRKQGRGSMGENEGEEIKEYHACRDLRTGAKLRKHATECRIAEIKKPIVRAIGAQDATVDLSIGGSIFTAHVPIISSQSWLRSIKSRKEMSGEPELHRRPRSGAMTAPA